MATTLEGLRAELAGSSGVKAAEEEGSGYEFIKNIIIL